MKLVTKVAIAAVVLAAAAAGTAAAVVPASSGPSAPTDLTSRVALAHKTVDADCVVTSTTITFKGVPVSTCGVDDTTGTIMITVPAQADGKTAQDPAAVSKLVSSVNAEVGSGMVTVTPHAIPQALSGRVGDGAGGNFTQGDKIVNDWPSGLAGCTSGFRVHAAAGPATPYVLTAGHCGYNGATNQWEFGDACNAPSICNGNFLGIMAYNGVELGTKADAALIAVGGNTLWSNVWVGPAVGATTQEYVEPTPLDRAAGQLIYTDGAISGQQLGQVQSTPFGTKFCATIDMTDSGYGTQVTCGNYWATPYAGVSLGTHGDSGGPVIIFDPAHPTQVIGIGVLSAGDPATGGVIYESLPYLLVKMNVALD